MLSALLKSDDVRRVDLNSVDLASVENEIEAELRVRLAFAPAVESVFLKDTAHDRAATSIVNSLVAMTVYDIFLISDWQTLHDQFMTMLIARVGIFTPVTLAFIIVATKTKSSKVAEWGGVGLCWLSVFLPMTVMVFSHSPFRLSYQFGSLLIMTFATVVQRIRFRPVCVGMALMTATQLTTTYLSDVFTAQTYTANLLFFLTTNMLLLLGSYLLERSERRAFLLALHGRILTEQIIESARRDALTGLFNRKYLAEVTRDIWAASSGTPRHVSLIMIDIDHFKRFNDSYGHLKGDECLCAIGAAIKTVAGQHNGLVFRFGGEEMLVLLPDADQTAAARVADAIRMRIRACAIPHPVTGDRAVVTASLGVASILAPAASVNDLMAAADAALYAAKNAGRDCSWPLHATVAPSSVDAVPRALSARAI